MGSARSYGDWVDDPLAPSVEEQEFLLREDEARREQEEATFWNGWDEYEAKQYDDGED